jgi:hypothetical protein
MRIFYQAPHVQIASAWSAPGQELHILDVPVDARSALLVAPFRPPVLDFDGWISSSLCFIFSPGMHACTLAEAEWRLVPPPDRRPGTHGSRTEFSARALVPQASYAAMLASPVG